MATETGADVTVIIVSYNTAKLTLRAIETLYANTRETSFDCVVFDNASGDGSAALIRAAFPQVQVISSDQNIGFAAANNRVAAAFDTPYLLLLNPDTETHPAALDELISFAKSRPNAGIWGGRTVFADGSLNISSCWAVPSLRSLFFRAFGIARLFKTSAFVNPEAYGGWSRDSIREVDIVVGCFLLIGRPLWQRLGGFQRKYYMYGEDADLCLRARDLGYRPCITPNAQITHHVGASTARNEEKTIAVMKARASILRDHWPKWKVGPGIALMWLWAALRYLGSRAFTKSRRASAEHWRAVWVRRAEWLRGYA
ncbi:hypothetical protein SAMN04488040_3211 [Sulfitobacter marinus]|uniref:Glycosyltransferase 2-like domain-containing protein n=1 Tax=Sulfitobacter marinus TaxID=394264 RepID=A0A1I6VCK9_9RHOB|nr:glycosyltransferase family 2 protein [Sulfitobacter marinus]SFT11254.1 hypothetical protein SAMN04488040_3211 [Sulfitobacter marinus]